MSDWPELDEARRVSRRRVLIAGASAMLVGTSCAGLMLSPVLRQGPYEKAPTGFAVLDGMRLAVLRAVAALALPGDADVDALCADVEETLHGLHVMQRQTVRTMLAYLEGATFAARGRLKPFTELDAATQRRVLDRWAASHVLVHRQTAVFLRQIVVMHHYEEHQA